ncbi:unnamed protein product [Amoebophrya sp. A25]|nr:unnamed protein product [Amoebophrya sp. A25]
MGAITAGSAKYNVLRKGLVDHEHETAKRAGRNCVKNLFLFPGGIAEIFQAGPGRHTIVLKCRRGLCRLCLESDSTLVPCYAFGVNDFYRNLLLSGSGGQESWIGKLSRKLQIGVALFWGPLGPFCPLVPFQPPNGVQFCFGEGIQMQQFCSDKTAFSAMPTEERERLVDKVLARYIEEIQTVFDKYKVVCGCSPDAKLEIL